FKSVNHIYAQIIDDSNGHVLASASSVAKDFTGSGGNIEAAKNIGSLLGDRASQKGIQKVVFDRNGYPYHGRVKALADAAREKGLVF
ncbi:MAG: 50S ribosomal protein L18, partial [Deltaproteobacteria bacterium]|nr:50S ribosomal protein L18 [Deltaproteobacteria bacterium]